MSQLSQIGPEIKISIQITQVIQVPYLGKETANLKIYVWNALSWQRCFVSYVHVCGDEISFIVKQRKQHISQTNKNYLYLNRDPKMPAPRKEALAFSLSSFFLQTQILDDV